MFFHRVDDQRCQQVILAAGITSSACRRKSRSGSVSSNGDDLILGKSLTSARISFNQNTSAGSFAAMMARWRSTCKSNTVGLPLQLRWHEIRRLRLIRTDIHGSISPDSRRLTTGVYTLTAVNGCVFGTPKLWIFDIDWRQQDQ